MHFFILSVYGWATKMLRNEFHVLILLYTALLAFSQTERGFFGGLLTVSLMPSGTINQSARLKLRNIFHASGKNPSSYVLTLSELCDVFITVQFSRNEGFAVSPGLQLLMTCQKSLLNAI